MEHESLGRRARKKAEIRSRLEQAALRLFDERGFDAVTIKDIAEMADVSERTFFRHFGSKESVLFAEREESIEQLARSLNEVGSDVPIRDALAGSAKLLAQLFYTDLAKVKLRARIAQQTESVRAYAREVVLASCERVLCTWLEERLTVRGPDDVRPRFYAGIAIAAVTSASATWTLGGFSADYDELVGSAFDELRALA